MTGYPPPGYAPDWFFIEQVRAHDSGLIAAQDEDDLPDQRLASAQKVRRWVERGTLTLWRRQGTGVSKVDPQTLLLPTRGWGWEATGVFGEPLFVRTVDLLFPNFSNIWWSDHDLLAVKSVGGRPGTVNQWLLHYEEAFEGAHERYRQGDFERELMIKIPATYASLKGLTWGTAALILSVRCNGPVNPDTLADAVNRQRRKHARG